LALGIKLSVFQIPGYDDRRDKSNTGRDRGEVDQATNKRREQRGAITLTGVPEVWGRSPVNRQE